jgi:Protein of unknown function (DUF4231)
MTNGKVTHEAERLREKVASYRAAHFKAGDHLRIWHYILGLLLIVTSAVVSGSVLQATNGNPSKNLTLAAGILSIAVTILTSVQTTFKVGERGELHRSAADGFGRIERKLEVFIERPHPDADKAWDDLGGIANEISNVEAGAPGYLRWTYNRAQRETNAVEATRR